jgi:transposase
VEATTGASSKRSFGSCGREARGVIFRPFFGNWNTVFKRYRDWVKADVFTRLFEACSDAADMEYAMVDATIVKVHRHGQGAKGGLRARPSAVPKAA